MSDIMYRYKNKIRIRKHRSVVMDAMLDYEGMKEWQPKLQKVVLEEGKFAEKGHSVILFFKNEETNESTIMYETIEQLDRPHKIVQKYQLGSTINTQTNYFENHGDETMWIVETEFHFEENPDVTKAIFQRKTRQGMRAFQRYVEGL